MKGEIGRGGEATTMGGEEDEETDSHVARLRGWENRKPGEAVGAAEAREDVATLKMRE